uniref:Uncharacterized protein n=1 Tax=Setaria digitata TaxID=48799 RepID=A0A915PX18_9BILA
MSSGRVTSNTRKGVITRTLGNSITVWPLDVHQQQELIFEDMRPVSSQYLKVGDWIQMEVKFDSMVVYREKIEPVLPTYVAKGGNVRIKTRLYFPDGLFSNCELLVGYSNDLGRVGVPFQCSELKADFSYDVWVSRPRKRHALLEKQHNVHWFLVRQRLIPLIRNNEMVKPLYGNWPVDGSSEQFNNTLTENSVNSHENDFSYALSFNNIALKRFYSDPRIRNAVYQCNSDFAHSIESYLEQLL